MKKKLKIIHSIFLNEINETEPKNIYNPKTLKPIAIENIAIYDKQIYTELTEKWVIPLILPTKC